MSDELSYWRDMTTMRDDAAGFEVQRNDATGHWRHRRRIIGIPRLVRPNRYLGESFTPYGIPTETVGDWIAGRPTTEKS